MTKDNAREIRFLEVKDGNYASLAKRLRSSPSAENTVRKTTSGIIQGVREKGDLALKTYVAKFDGLPKGTDLRVSSAEIRAAYGLVSNAQIRAIEELKTRVEKVEEGLLKTLSGLKISFDGYSLSLKVQALEAVGCYVPGGQASYPTSLIMTVVPAKVAGVARIIVSSPPSKSGLPSPLTLVASDICGVDEVYKMGGAHAIAAMALGTASIPSVKKIVGPGNNYVTTAKVLLSEIVPIDLPAGPTELLIMADARAKPQLIARDMISQAEHGGSSICGLVTTSSSLASRVKNELGKIMVSVPRSKEVREALSSNGFILVAKSLQDMVRFSNSFAPEHLEIMVEDAEEVSKDIENAGMILLGNFSPSSISDYCLGTNHVLPTGGAASAYSALSVLTFIKTSWIANCEKKALEQLVPKIKILSDAEELNNHLLAVEERLR